VKFDWIKSIPDYQGYFNDDHQRIINLIGIDEYLKLQEHYGKTGIYFGKTVSNDRDTIIEIIGEENYEKLYQSFGNTSIFFGSRSITLLKKAWAVNNRSTDYNEAARMLDVSVKTIYNWRNEAITI